jgi:hypothetical protein
MWLTRGGVKTRDFLIRLEATCHKHHTEQEARTREKQKPKINREFIAWWEWGDQTRKGDGDPIRSHLLAAHRSPSPLPLPLPPPLVVLVAVSSPIYFGVFIFFIYLSIYIPPPPRFFFFLLPRVVAAAGVSARVPRVSFRPSQLALRAAARRRSPIGRLRRLRGN